MKQLLFWQGIPFFLALNFLGTAVEYAIFRWKKKSYSFDAQESWVTLQIFFLQALTNALFVSVNGAILLFLYKHRPFDFHLSFWPALVVGLFFSELCYYWSHRYLHRVRLGWANHLVHHVPKKFNVSMDYRVTITGPLALSWLFFLPLALLGYPPVAVGMLFFINQVYQFWVHTELDPKIPVLEKIFVMPSHHRVHHDTSAECLDKNYGGVFIFFDKIFGTFKEEDKNKTPSYGVIEKVNSRSLYESTMMGWVYLFRDVKNTSSFFDKLKLFVMPPEWKPASLKSDIQKSSKSIDRAEGF